MNTAPPVLHVWPARNLAPKNTLRQPRITTLATTIMTCIFCLAFSVGARTKDTAISVTDDAATMHVSKRLHLTNDTSLSFSWQGVRRSVTQYSFKKQRYTHTSVFYSSSFNLVQNRNECVIPGLNIHYDQTWKKVLARSYSVRIILSLLQRVAKSVKEAFAFNLIECFHNFHMTIFQEPNLVVSLTLVVSSKSTSVYNCPEEFHGDHTKCDTTWSCCQNQGVHVANGTRAVTPG